MQQAHVHARIARDLRRHRSGFVERRNKPRLVRRAPATTTLNRCDDTDMRKGFSSLALLVQEAFRRDPHTGDLWVFRGRRGDLIKVVWHDGQGACLFTKRLECGRFLWPSVADGVVTISAAQLGYLRSGIDWRMPQGIWRPTTAG